MRTPGRLRIFAVFGVAAFVAVGCTGGAGGGDKAGGGGEPVVFRLANATAWGTELIFNPADGKWENESGDTGTYQVDGDRFVFDWHSVPGFGYAMTFTFSADKKGNLRLMPVLPMDPRDVFV